MDGFVSCHSFILHVCLLSHHYISVSICKIYSASIIEKSVLKSWSRGNTLDSRLGDAQLKSRLGHWLCWGCSWFYWVSPTKYQDSTLITQQLLPCICFLTSPTIQWYMTSVLKALLITFYKMKKLVDSSIICFVSICTINFPCILLYFFPASVDISFNSTNVLRLTLWLLVLRRTIPMKRPSLGGKVSTNFCR
jgi:hypothetical protein